jgi:membrane protein YqaA with SNARE-associated domain
MHKSLSRKDVKFGLGARFRSRLNHSIKIINILFHVFLGIRNEFLCKFYGFLTTHVLYSTLLITIIAFDRYFCICWPLYKIITIRRARAIVIFCGLLSSLLGIVSLFPLFNKE